MSPSENASVYTDKSPTNYITRLFEFDAGHRVYGHRGKCQHFHGHRYKLEVSICSPGLDDLGMVLDFGLLKDIVDKIISRYDHNMIVYDKDPIAQCEEFWKLHNKKPVIITLNPTVENIIKVLASEIIEGLKEDQKNSSQLISLMYLKLNETPNCYAEWFDPEFYN